MNRFLNVLLLLTASLAAAERFDPLMPYDGPRVRGVDTSTLTGKVMAGYQGWFNCEGDGAELGSTHWARDRSEPFAPGNVTVDLWPDVSEYADGRALHATGFEARRRLARRGVQFLQPRHRRSGISQWMRDYGIDGAFVQRFANGLERRRTAHHKDVVLAHAREGANRAGRAYAVMYDLSGLPPAA